ncbi:MAG: hypothetical protein K6F99_10345 [Lachnospiraceae bacterium]|nr:hypothetical protein [Lachnospiraceae bacterium]
MPEINKEVNAQLNRGIKVRENEQNGDQLIQHKNSLYEREHKVSFQEKQMPFSEEKADGGIEIPSTIHSFKDRIELLRNEEGERPVFKTRELFGKEEQDKYKAELFAEKNQRLHFQSNDRQSDAKRAFVRLANKREQIYANAELLKEAIKNVKSKQDKDSVLKLRLKMAETEYEVQKEFSVVMLRDDYEKEFNDLAALIRKLKTDLEIYADAYKDGLNVEEEAKAVREELSRREEEIRRHDLFEDYKDYYQYEHRGKRLSLEADKDKEEILKESDFEQSLLKSDKKESDFSDLEERQNRLNNSKFKNQEDSSRMKAVKTSFNALCKTLKNPPGKYEEQRKAIYACYEETKKACQKYIKDHTDKYFGFMRSKEGIERRRLVQEYLDRITFEQANLFKNMDDLLEQNPCATWVDALNETSKTAEIHLEFLNSQEISEKKTDVRTDWKKAAPISNISDE